MVRLLELLEPRGRLTRPTRLAGVVLVLYFRILRLMYNNRKRTFMDTFMVVFSTVLVLLNTIFWTTQTYFGEMMWITHADYPGGSDQYWADFGSVWYQIWGMAACVVCNLMNDALLVCSCSSSAAPPCELTNTRHTDATLYGTAAAS